MRKMEGSWPSLFRLKQKVIRDFNTFVRIEVPPPTKKIESAHPMRQPG